MSWTLSEIERAKLWSGQKVARRKSASLFHPVISNGLHPSHSTIIPNLFTIISKVFITVLKVFINCP
jgi:hypothetical protein